MSTSSLGRFRYGLRPAKNIERKMFCQTFATLSCLSPLTAYRYIGFGVLEFVDFTLFHQRLGINDMISIEADEDATQRINFNRPYSCIKMRWGSSNEVLPKLRWSKRTIIWLDYDTPLNDSILSDIRLVSSCVVSGSVVIVTVDAQPTPFAQSTADIHAKRLHHLKSNVGSNNIPINTKGSDLNDWGLARVCRQIIDNEIKSALLERNAPFPESSRIEYKQLFNIHYADGAKMLTVGGTFLSPADQQIFTDDQLNNLEFIRHNKDEYFIETPMLTLRELRHLDRRLPAKTFSKYSKGIPPEAWEKYRKVYRYFPTFNEVEAR